MDYAIADSVLEVDLHAARHILDRAAGVVDLSKVNTDLRSGDTIRSCTSGARSSTHPWKLQGVGALVDLGQHQ